MKKTHLYILLDSSGSMKPKTQMVVDSVNEFLEEQKKESGDCFVSFYTFSKNLKCLYEDREIRTIPAMTEDDFDPYGTTALWDALAGVLDSIPVLTNQELETDLQVLVVITDGEENTSRFNKPLDIKNKIKCKNALEIVYVGSNQDAILNGNIMGIESSLEYNDEKMKEAVRATSGAIRRYRSNKTPTVSFTPIDREVSL